MSEFKNVRLVKKANVYFGGNVTSRTVIFEDGSKKTLGIALPGEYTFNTEEKELMEILSGDLQFKLAGEDEWREGQGEISFEVPAKSSFTVRVKTTTDYCCFFIK